MRHCHGSEGSIPGHRNRYRPSLHSFTPLTHTVTSLFLFIDTTILFCFILYLAYTTLLYVSGAIVSTVALSVTGQPCWLAPDRLACVVGNAACVLDANTAATVKTYGSAVSAVCTGLKSATPLLVMGTARGEIEVRGALMCFEANKDRLFLTFFFLCFWNFCCSLIGCGCEHRQDHALVDRQAVGSQHCADVC